jgi:hypothetical protein
MGGACSSDGEGRGVYSVQGNIKMDLQELRRGDVEWNELAQDRDRWRTVVNAVMKLRVP